MTRLGKYESLVPLWERKDFFIASDTILIRVPEPGPFDVATATTEIRLLDSISSPFVPTPLEVGIDEGSGRFFYTMRLPGPLDRVSLGKTENDARTTFTALVTALDALHRSRIAYRNIRPKTIARVSPSQVVFFDFSAATRFGPTRMVRRLKTRTAYDAPETDRDEYDGVLADIFALGALVRQMCDLQGRLCPVPEVVEQMTDPDPRKRPNTMAEILNVVGN